MKKFDLTIVGELNLDLILYGLPETMLTERELLATGFRATLGSSSAIVAHNASRLGSSVAFTTLIGEDDFGRMALGRLDDAGVDTTRAVRHPSISTGITVLLPHGDRRHILTYSGTIAELKAPTLDFDFLIQARHLHLSSLYLQLGLHDGLVNLLARLKDAGLTLSLDTNDDPNDRWGPPLWEILPLIDVFMPSEDELIRMTRCSDVDDAVRALPVTPPIIAVKRGKRGARLYTAGVTTDIDPIRVVPVDTIGAGDSFDAGFLRAYLLSRDPVTCARTGNITGALSTQAAGGTEAFRDSALRDSFLRAHNFFKLIEG